MKSVTFKFWVSFELSGRHCNLKPKRFDFCIEYKTTDRTCPFHYQWLKLFGLLEEIGIKSSVAFLKCFSIVCGFIFGPRQANLLLIAYASSEGSGEPAHPRSLARTFAARSYKQWVKRNLQTESQIPAPSEWLGMRSWNLSWRNARRHKFVWRGPFAFIMPKIF